MSNTAYLVQFKNKFTKNKWLGQNFLFNRKTQAEANAKRLTKTERDDKNITFKTTARVVAVDKKTSPYNKMSAFTFTR